MKRLDFTQILAKNESVLVVFFTGPNCKFCEEIKPYVIEKLKNCSYPHLLLDKIADADVFAAMQKYKQMKGIPALLAYSKNNVTYMANLSISGTNQNEIECFFDSLDFL